MFFFENIHYQMWQRPKPLWIVKYMFYSSWLHGTTFIAKVKLSIRHAMQDLYLFIILFVCNQRQLQERERDNMKAIISCAKHEE
jgi:hypothetical protein